MKKCSKCGLDKSVSEFSKNKTNRDRLNGLCKACKREQSKAWMRSNPEKHRAYCRKWRRNNPERKLELDRLWKRRNRAIIREKSAVWRAANRELTRKSYKEWSAAHPSQIRLFAKKYRFNHLIQARTAVRINHALQRVCGSPNRKSVFYIGCSWPEYKTYLEKLFTAGMTWEKFNSGEIHIDHIRPISSFDLTNEVELTSAFHFTNTQPLWARDNLIKSNKERSMLLKCRLAAEKLKAESEG